MCKEHFEWQDEYFAVSVSESGVNAVREYIKNQETHHAKKILEEEHDEFIKKYGFTLIKETLGFKPEASHELLRASGRRLI